MQPRLPLVFVAILVFGSLSGCMAGDPAGLKKDLDTPLLTGKAHVMDVLQKLPWAPGYRKEEALNWWVGFVTNYNKREWGTPQDAAAAQFLESELKRIGFQSETLVLRGAVKAQNTELPVEGDWRVVRGVRAGAGNASHRIALVSHYDVHTGTTQGAYDNGAGVAIQFETCKLLARVATNKTIECLFFDGEEKGLRGSELYVRDFLKGGKNYTYDMAFGFDMTGLNYPGYSQWKFYAHAGVKESEKFTDPVKESNMAFLNTTLFEFLGPRQNVKPAGVESRLGNARSSDERQFEKLLGIPIVRFSGGEKAADYLMYHRPGDTVEFVYLTACGLCREFQTLGRDIFAKGMEFATVVAYYTILAYDQFDPFQLPLTSRDEPKLDAVQGSL